MRPAGYGETQPRLDDDRLPIVLVILDGLGDRPIPELGDRTPAEAAHTPHLDALARAGASGWHLPFGWGLAPASERAHWAVRLRRRALPPGAPSSKPSAPACPWNSTSPSPTPPCAPPAAAATPSGSPAGPALRTSTTSPPCSRASDQSSPSTA
jgi:hypothetical protein